MYKLTFQDYKKTKYYLELPFDSDSEVLTLINLFNSENDYIKCIDCKKTIFEGKNLIVKNGVFSTYKVLLLKKGFFPMRKSFYSDSDSKAIKILNTCFKIDAIAKDNRVDL